MKTLFYFLLSTLINSSLIGQKNAPVIPQNCNTIVITDTISPPLKFNQLTTILFENGIGIQQSDRESGTILTTPVAFKNGTYTLTFLVKDNKIIARGQWTWDMTVKLSGVTNDPNPIGDITFGGQRNSARRNAWDAFHKIIGQVPGSREYFVR